MGMKIRYYFDLIVVLTQKEIKVRYKNSYLGYLWSVAHPLAFASVFFLAFQVVMRIDIENYTLFLIGGLFPWQWFSNSVNTSSTIFIQNASIIKKVYFPNNSLIVANVLQDAIHFFLSIPVIVFFLFLYDQSASWRWIYGIPVLFSVQFLLIYGICLAVSSINLFIRDLERLVGIVTTLLFYFTPIIYPETMMPDQYKYLLSLNPVAPLMISWRNLFLKGVLNQSYLVDSFIYASAAFLIGFAIYRMLASRFAEVL